MMANICYFLFINKNLIWSGKFHADLFADWDQFFFFVDALVFVHEVSHFVLFLATSNAVDFSKYSGNMYLSVPVMLIRHFFHLVRDRTIDLWDSILSVTYCVFSYRNDEAPIRPSTPVHAAAEDPRQLRRADPWVRLPHPRLPRPLQRRRHPRRPREGRSDGAGHLLPKRGGRARNLRRLLDHLVR